MPLPVTETQPPDMPRSVLIARVWRNYLSPHKGLLGLALTGAVVVAITTSLLAWWLGPSIDLLFHTAAADTALRLFSAAARDWMRAHPMLIVPLVIIVAAAIRFIGQRVLTVSLNQLGNQLVATIQQQLFSRLVHADLGRLQTAHSGQYLSSVLYDADLVRDAASTGVVQYVQSALIVIGGLITMFVYDWTMSLIVLLAGPLIAVVMGRYLRLTAKAAKGAMAETSSLSTAVMESLDGVKIIKISHQEAFEEARVGEVIARRLHHMIRGANARSMAAPATEVLTAFLMAGLLAYAGWRAESGAMTAGSLFAFIMALGTASQGLRQLSGLQGTFSQGMVAARRLFAALDVQPEITDAEGALDLPRDFKTVSFEDVSFAYGDAAVLKNVSLSAKPGETVALVGPSGSGKSTLLNLIPRFFDLTSGAIRFGDLDHRQIALSALRSRIALVTQDPFLFDDTIRANIAYGNGNPSQDEIEQAAKDAAAHDFIMELPQGYDTRAGEAGSRLSGGQKQRIAIARAFLKNAPLLLLDEATSALDTESEIKVQSALERLMHGRTTFVVAHRLSTVRHADQILVLSAGEIVERGTHDQLLAAGGLYARLAASQFDLPIQDKTV
ncbi:ABC transporter ATP-binding protein [Asticcacaulis sp. EMRT-3]|uniref:ABC transporter ATP-binding protein n=1 Tax=Asticcacaulis sp. EMRT-3 TaxID=3040349 RepID=UPI0024AF0A20|nr:ABC transporter ATP-binding protein [Asticcacaulis sp. EMRT-3]MDI7774088.1 ABC transporter ATP-binding protein [Asticcacaulis sp. EMRT-3]